MSGEEGRGEEGEERDYAGEQMQRTECRGGNAEAADKRRIGEEWQKMR